MDMVPESLWILKDETKSELLVSNAPRPQELIDQIIHSATPTMPPNLVKCTDRVGYIRYVVTFNLSKELVDQFFNGRSGYRAQYYLSPEAGELFNRLCVEGLVQVVQNSLPPNGLDQWATMKHSLLGRYSKVWVVETGNMASDLTLNISRWSNIEIQKYEDSQIRLNGTFIHQNDSSAEPYIPDSKKNRAFQIHQNGWT